MQTSKCFFLSSTAVRLRVLYYLESYHGLPIFCRFQFSIFNVFLFNSWRTQGGDGVELQGHQLTHGRGHNQQVSILKTFNNQQVFLTLQTFNSWQVFLTLQTFNNQQVFLTLQTFNSWQFLTVFNSWQLLTVFISCQYYHCLI